MKLGDVMRELGLDMFASSSASASSDSGQQELGPEGFDGVDDADDFDDFDDFGDEFDEFDDDFEEDYDEFDDDFDTDEESESDDVVLDKLDDISYELEQLSAQVEDNQSSVRALRGEREEVIERLDEIEDNNATLLGVYDRLTTDINPFAADWDERYDRKVSEQDGPMYGVVEPPENEAEARAAAAREQREEDDGETDDAPGDGLSFDDLKNKHGDPEAAVDVEPEPDPDPEPVTATFTPQPGSVSGDEPYLTGLAPTYATEVLVMQWMSHLIDVAGPAGAMKALDFYERINWISPRIKRQLEDVLSGAHDAGDTPSRHPSDLTAEEHNQSFAHIMRLAQQTQLARGG